MQGVTLHFEAMLAGSIWVYHREQTTAFQAQSPHKNKCGVPIPKADVLAAKRGKHLVL